MSNKIPRPELISTVLAVSLTLFASPTIAMSCDDLFLAKEIGPNRVKMSVPGSNEALVLTVSDEVFRGTPLYAYRLVQNAMQEIRNRAKSPTPVHKVLVVGTGAGFEAIALAKAFPEIHVSATDISSNAVQMTMTNASEHQLIGRVNAWKADLMDRMKAKYDLILFNAPRAVWKSQIRAEKDDLNTNIEWNNILREPGFFDPDGVLLSRFLEQIPDRLLPGGAVLLMTNEHLTVALPDGLRDLILSKDPWGKSSPDNFVIRRLSLNPL